MLGDELAELAHDFTMVAEREIGVDAVLEREQAQLLEALAVRARKRLGGQVGGRRPAPQRERLPEPVAGRRRVASVEEQPALLAERGESLGVVLPGPQAQHVAGGPRHQQLVLATTPS